MESSHSDNPVGVAVETYRLHRSFGTKVAVESLDLRVEEGEFYGFLGPNGAGKSTTIKILCGLLRPGGGGARVLGRDVATQAIDVKRLIGVLPEEPVLYQRLTPLEHLRLVASLHGLEGGEIERRSRELLDVMEIDEEDRRKMVIGFSMGMRKKVALACALVHGPRVLFLDEPFNGIDAVTVRAIRNLLQSAVARGLTVFFSSHILELVERLCTRIGIIARGRLLAEGDLAALRTQVGMDDGASLEDVFVHLVGGEREGSSDLEFLGR